MSFKNTDFFFLTFLLLVTQGSIQLKIIGVLIFLVIRPTAVLKVTGLGKFYVFILIFHLAYGIINLALKGIQYLPTYLLVTLLWFMAFIIIAQIYDFFKKSSVLKIESTINIYFLICVGIVVFQVIGSMIHYGAFNPYGASPAAGDRMSSIFSNSSVSMIVMSFFFLKYIFSRKWIYSIMALGCLLMATYMSGTAIFLLAALFSMFFFSKAKVMYKLYFILVALVFSTLFVVTSPENIKYASGYINRIVEFEKSDLPFKIKSFWQTIEYWFSSAKHFIFGAGGGNFSSRAAFIISGDYVDWYPKSLVYVSEEFREYHLNIWTHDYNNPWDNRNNTANQPFSFYNKIFGEYGLLGIMAFGFYYLKYIFKKWNFLTYSRFMIVALAGYFVLDYWFEYFSVIVLFETLFLCDIRLSNIKDKHF